MLNIEGFKLARVVDERCLKEGPTILYIQKPPGPVGKHVVNVRNCGSIDVECGPRA